MKKVKLLFILTAMFLLAIATACGSSSSTGDSASGEPAANTSNENEGSQSNEPAEVVELSMGHMNSTDHAQHWGAMVPFTEEVLELTEGRVKFEIYPGGALGGPAETWDNIMTGIMDSGWGLQGYNANVFPVHSVLHLPFLADGDSETLSIVAQQLYETFPEIQAEYENVKPLWFHAENPYAIITKGKAVRTFEDIKGLKLRAPSVEATEMLKTWGATPVSMPAPEIYDAMQKGVIDGGVLPISAIGDFNLFDVVDYVSTGNFNTSLFYVVMNKNSWEKISPEDQQLIEENFIGKPMAQRAGQAFLESLAQATETAKANGTEFIEIPEEELVKFREAAKPVEEEWVTRMEQNGIDGKKILEETKRLIQEAKESKQ